MDTDDMARRGRCPECGRKLTAMADECLCCPVCGWYEGAEDEPEDDNEQEDEK
jgi:uncharacterized Zn finger protein (UPF0148 family)